MLYYISDLHFGHANIIKLCNRPFADVSDMNETLIARWNGKVTGSDTVYIVGDLFFRMADDPAAVLSRLKGKKHLIVGNHDKTWLPRVDAAKYFKSVQPILTFAAPEGKITLCHYPMLCFEGRYHIYGHIHANRTDPFFPLLASTDNAFNASAEVNGYAPVTFGELVRNNERFRRPPPVPAPDGR